MDEEHVHGGGSILADPIGNDRGREKKETRRKSMMGNRMRRITGEILGFSERATPRGARC
jgi:hypothetical protein